MTSEGRIGIQRQRAEKLRKQGKNKECGKRAEKPPGKARGRGLTSYLRVAPYANERFIERLRPKGFRFKIVKRLRRTSVAL